jgi:hypothetical protein
MDARRNGARPAEVCQQNTIPVKRLTILLTHTTNCVQNAYQVLFPRQAKLATAIVRVGG